MSKMRKVIVNTTPLIALAEIGELHLLKDLYDEIYIPNAVFEEVKSEPAYTEVRNASEWIKQVSVDSADNREMLSSRLHSGEVEVIQYARESKADLVILDDQLARRTAKFLGLTITGTLGVIIKAKEKGYVSSVSFSHIQFSRIQFSSASGQAQNSYSCRIFGISFKRPFFMRIWHMTTSSTALSSARTVIIFLFSPFRLKREQISSSVISI